MSRNENSAGSGLVERLLAIMARLRDPEHGCPWDLEQTFYSIAPYTVEEAHEVADAIERGNFDDLREELGDLLFQVVFHARMAEEKGLFDFEIGRAPCRERVEMEALLASAQVNSMKTKK